MPNYDYKCLNCLKKFEVHHSINESYKKCDLCGSENIKKLISAVYFKVQDGTGKFGNHGYTGRHRDLVKSMKGNKDYQNGFRKELEQQNKKSLSEWKAEQQMQKSQETFQKMKAEGEKMTKEEKEKIKEEYGIKKGMKAGQIGL